MRAWSRLEVAIEAVCDVDPARARALATEHGVPAAFGGLDEALEAVQVDFVDIAAGPEAHPELGRSTSRRWWWPAPGAC
jgi:predicted dehydrogenase